MLCAALKAGMLCAAQKKTAGGAFSVTLVCVCALAIFSGAVYSVGHQGIIMWRFPEIGVPLFIIHFNGIFPSKPSILVYPN